MQKLRPSFYISLFLKISTKEDLLVVFVNISL